LESKSFHNHLNESQKKAVTWGRGPLLVLAGPGSGKTLVITERIRYLTETLKVRPSEILVVTFSRAAAQEMKERFLSFRIADSALVTFGTFHSFFFGILRTAYGYSADQVASDEERMNIVLDLIRKYRIGGEDPKSLAVNLISEIAVVKEEKAALENYYSANCPGDVFRLLFSDYEKSLGKIRKIDYEDMLLMTYDLLKQREDIRFACEKHFRWILVDEFQDINLLQYEIVKMIAGEQANITAVGDDDQSIYQFRGAKPEIMLGFKKDYPSAGEVLLDRNYRSTPEIISAASLLISCNTKRFAKRILPVRPHAEPVRMIRCEDPLAEAEYITGKIRRIRKSGTAGKDIAVLYRTNLQPRILARKLTEENIPFQMKEYMPDLMDHWIAKDFLAYILFSHGDRSRGNLLRLMNRPNRFIRRDALQDENAGLLNLECYYAGKEKMTERIRRLCYDIEVLSKMDVSRAIAYIRREIGYDDFLSEYAALHGIEKGELEETADEIEDSSEGFPTAERWITNWKELHKNITGVKDENGEKKADRIFLMTFHASKGLEFKNVFIMDANRGITPYRKARTGDETEEERRMFYVAMTRAKDSLEILTCRKRFHREAEPSVFINEIMQKGEH